MTQQDITVNLGTEINIDLADVTSTIDIKPLEITVNLASITTANFVAADSPFYLDGQGGNSYFKFNSTTSRVELWVEGVKQKEWGVVSGNPFA